MFARILTVFRIPELRQKIILTLILLAVYRLGFYIPLSFLDQDKFFESMRRMTESQGTMGQVMQAMSMFSASSMGNATIFGLGIMPYISASIIFQLMATVYPPLEALQKEGEAGRKKINEYTRYATVVISLAQSFFWVMYLRSQGLILESYNGFFGWTAATLTMTAGTVLLMWIGEQIDEYGIGNGISLLIMAGILSRIPDAIRELLGPAFANGTFNIQLGSKAGIDKLMLLGGLFVAVIIGVIAMTTATRRIPIQSAKHVRGRRVMGGQRQFLPLRINQSGVMPIIFASSLLLIPISVMTTVGTAAQQSEIGWVRFISPIFFLLDSSERGFIYNLLFILLIYFFCYFWTGITFNPKDISENLKDHGSFIPGYRPGARTADYLDQVMHRITYVGAGFLALIAIVPTLISSSMQISPLVASFYGGTGLLICVSVALDLVQKIDSHLVMMNKGGLLEADDPA
ncbi:MAG: preprotein translocase subunit SecY [Planctomycetota bacterium]|jgi:preprotein translocase subunit SecY|nr:MAG: preprotein translocase subunit SecY [Planctomycetota bacterium]